MKIKIKIRIQRAAAACIKTDKAANENYWDTPPEYHDFGGVYSGTRSFAARMALKRSALLARLVRMAS